MSIFGRDIDEEGLATAVDGAEHLETSQASRRLTALSSALPIELASHIQVNVLVKCLGGWKRRIKVGCHTLVFVICIYFARNVYRSKIW